MKKISIFTLLLTLLVFLTGCDNGSVSDSSVSKSSGLVKVCLTVDGDSSGAQKTVNAGGSYWTSLTYQYNAVPQWIDPQGTPIHGATSWLPINYSTGMSLGYFAPGQWVFGVRIKNGATVVYEGYSEVIEVKNASVNVDVLVNKLVTNAVVGSVRIAVTAPAEEDDTLSISYSGTSSGGPFTDPAEYDSAKYPFEYTVPGLTAGTYTFTLTHSVGSVAGSIDVTLASGEMAVISGHLDNGRWQLEYYTVKVYTVTAAPASHGSVQVNTEFAAVGDRVSFYPKPVSGSTLISVSVTCGGNPVTFTYSEKMYSFTMPDGNVTVSATFDVVDTSINLSHFKTILKAFYDSNPGVTAFGRSAVEPSGVEYLGIKDVKIWYDSTLTKICWYSGAGNEITFNNDDTSMADLFKDCTNYLDISMDGIKTANITDMHGMFENCANLQVVDLNGVVTTLVTNMSRMFYKAGTNYVPRKGGAEDGKNMQDNTNNLLIKNLRFNTSACTNMSRMFQLSSINNLCSPEPRNNNEIPTNISSWVTSSVTNMSYMFAGEYGRNPATYTYNKVASLDLSSWNTSSVTDFSYMFDYCNRLTTMNISNFDFASATTITRLFDRCESLTSLTFPSHTVLDNVTDMCWALSSIDKLTVNDWEAILACWDIDRCPIAFIDYAGTPTESSENPNRIYKGKGTILDTTTNARREFCTYGHNTPNVYFGGKGTGVNTNDAQRLVKITP